MTISGAEEGGSCGGDPKLCAHPWSRLKAPARTSQLYKTTVSLPDESKGASRSVCEASQDAASVSFVFLLTVRGHARRHTRDLSF